MSRKRYTPEQIIGMLREAEVLLSQGVKTPEVCRRLGVSEQILIERWRVHDNTRRPAFGSGLPTTGARSRLDQPRSGRLPFGPATTTWLAKAPDPLIEAGPLKSGWSCTACR